MDMQNMLSRVIARSVPMLLAVILAACGTSAPVRFYILSPVQIEQSNSAIKTRAASQKEHIISVGPIDIPRYIDRGALLVFTKDNRLELKEFDRWGEPVAEGMTRAIAGNLAALFPSATINTYPFSGGRTAAGHQVSVEVVKMNIHQDGLVDFLANWAILDINGRSTVTRGQTQFQRTTAPNDMEAAVRTLSYGISVLSQEVAVKLATL
jgi:uncharacterized lipoprotein YmbA